VKETNNKGKKGALGLKIDILRKEEKYHFRGRGLYGF
jgi:hypothetical protein